MLLNTQTLISCGLTELIFKIDAKLDSISMIIEEKTFLNKNPLLKRKKEPKVWTS